MKLKRILALICAFALLLSMTACGKKKTETASDSEAAQSTAQAAEQSTEQSADKDIPEEPTGEAGTIESLPEGLSQEDIEALSELLGDYSATVPLDDLELVSLTVSDLIALGFTVDADLTRTLRPGEVSEELTIQKEDFTAAIQVSNPSTVDITLEAGVIAVCTIYGEALAETEIYSTGIASLDALFTLYGEPYRQTAEEVVYQVYADERIDFSDVESLYEGYTGEAISENYKLVFALAGEAITAISLADPALLWGGLTGSMDEEDLESMSYEEIVAATEVRDDILDTLVSEFAAAELDVTVDELTGEIRLAEAILFANDSAELTEDGKAYLDKVCAVYADVLLSEAYRDHIAGIRFEGHTSTTGTYDYNLQLSEDRAAAVLDYCLTSETGELTDEQRTELESLSETVGYSYTDPIFDETGEVDMDASRRVVIRFLLDPASFAAE